MKLTTLYENQEPAESESEMFDKLWKYYEYIMKNPNSADLITLGNLMARKFPDKLHNMLPFIDKIINKLPDGEKVKEHYSKLKININTD